jgi:hypothetical protein
VPRGYRRNSAIAIAGHSNSQRTTTLDRDRSLTLIGPDVLLICYIGGIVSAACTESPLVKISFSSVFSFRLSAYPLLP